MEKRWRTINRLKVRGVFLNHCYSIESGETLIGTLQFKKEDILISRITYRQRELCDVIISVYQYRIVAGGTKRRYC